MLESQETSYRLDSEGFSSVDPRRVKVLNCWGANPFIASVREEPKRGKKRGKATSISIRTGKTFWRIEARGWVGPMQRNRLASIQPDCPADLDVGRGGGGGRPATKLSERRKAPRLWRDSSLTQINLLGKG